MLKHIVMWNVRGSTPDERSDAASRIKSSFESLIGKIPGMLHLEIGFDISRSTCSCDVVLYPEFENQSALDAYSDHPAHLAVKQQVDGIRIARHQVDYSPNLED